MPANALPYGLVSGLRSRLAQTHGRFGPLAVNNRMLSEQASPTDLLKPAEVAAQLGVSRTWLYGAAKPGRIPSIRIGGRKGPFRFIDEDLQSWIADARAECTSGDLAQSASLDPVDALAQRSLRFERGAVNSGVAPIICEAPTRISATGAGSAISQRRASDGRQA